MFFPSIIPSSGGGGVPGFGALADAFFIPDSLGLSSVDPGNRFIFSLESTEKRVFARKTGINSGSAGTLENQDTASNYQVPSAKTSRAVIEIIEGTGNGDIKVWASDTLDTADGTLLYTITNNTSGAKRLTPVLTFASQKYLTVEHVTGGSNQVTAQAYIAEEI